MLLTLFAVSLLLMAAVPWYGAALGVMFVVGVGSATFISLGTTIIQLHVPGQFLGRVMSIWTAGAAFTMVGALPMGIVGDAFGLRFAVGGAAVLTLAFTLWLGVLRPPIRRMAV